MEKRLNTPPPDRLSDERAGTSDELPTAEIHTPNTKQTKSAKKKPATKKKPAAKKKVAAKKKAAAKKKPAAKRKAAVKRKAAATKRKSAKHHCDQCPKSYGEMKNLIAHQRRIHCEFIDRYVCRECGDSSYVDPWLLKKHLHERHGKIVETKDLAKTKKRVRNTKQSK